MHAAVPMNTIMCMHSRPGQKKKPLVAALALQFASYDSYRLHTNLMLRVLRLAAAGTIKGYSKILEYNIK